MAVIDFEPSFCSANAITQCLEARECKLPQLSLPGLNFGFAKALDGMLSIQLQLNATQLCLITALTQAFLAAGVPMPTIPSAPEPPDFSACKQSMQDMVDEAASPLGSMGGLYQITFDGSGIPTRITV